MDSGLHRIAETAISLVDKNQYAFGVLKPRHFLSRLFSLSITISMTSISLANASNCLSMIHFSSIDLV